MQKGIQKGLCGIESSQEQKAKEGRLLEQSTKALLANYQKKVYQLQLLTDLYHYAKEKISFFLFQWFLRN